MNFLERNGLAAPKVIIREDFPASIQNAVSDALDIVIRQHRSDIRAFDHYIWCEIYHLAMKDYRWQPENGLYFFRYKLDGDDINWANKLLIVEEFAKWLRDKNQVISADTFKALLNQGFEKRNYAYRFVGDNIEEVTSAVEIQTIEEALTIEDSSVKLHLDTALNKISVANQEPDYRNSIKESISAVEAYCRSITNTSSLGDAIKALEKNGFTIHSQMKAAFLNLYTYTNDEDAGARHAWMVYTNEPTADEAVFMLVTCSAFLNYLTKKNNKL